MTNSDVVILGIFVADLAFRAKRLPVMGETILGQSFTMGPGGKGSNQVIAAARAGAKTALISRIGGDNFGKMAQETWQQNNIDMTQLHIDKSVPTGAAFIFVSSESGDNAIIVESGAGSKITAQDMRAATATIAQAKIFMTQFEQPIDAAIEGLKIARAHGVTTILNPAPAVEVDDAIYALCDYVTPNETEAAALSGVDTSTDEGVKRAAQSFIDRGARNVLVTLGAKGAFLLNEGGGQMFDAVPVDNIVETAGAGDAFNGGLATALAEGCSLPESIKFACVTAALSIQKAGTAPSMPYRHEIDSFMHAQKAPR